jgi:putative ABC transport system permease protein
VFFAYLRRELRRRTRQAVIVSLGLALGIGLAIAVTAASTGVKNAQAQVLHSLYGVGTDISVTQPAAGASAGPGFRIGLGGGSGSTAKAGTSFRRDTLTSAGLGTLSQSAVSKIASLDHVSAAAGALALTDNRISGTISSSSTGPSAGSFNTSSFTVDGVDVHNSKTGVLSSATIVSGHTFTSSDTDASVALVSSDYAASHKLAAGSSITVAGKKFTVIGTVRAASGSSSVDVYIPLARAQALSGLNGDVNTIYVTADSSSNISGVAKEISAALPTATVTTASSLASQVGGSISTAARLAGTLGTWLTVAVLAAAFGLASLLTMSAVSRRVREFGTLKSLGWTSRRVVRQVMGESLATGIIGGVAGLALGFAAVAVIDAVAPSLTASSGLPGSGSAGAFAPAARRLAAGAGNTVTVHLTPTLTVSAIGLAVLLALAGGLLAGSLGGWRAARMRPAAAMTRVA